MNVCDKCFADLEIKQFINSTSKNQGRCDCCDDEGYTVDVNEILDFFAEFITIFKYNMDGKPLLEIIQEDWNIFSSNSVGSKFFKSADVSIVLDLSMGLSISNISFDPMLPVSYIDDITESVSFWGKLKDDLKWKRRFLTDIGEMEDMGWDAMFNVFTILDSKSNLYRARINQKGQTTAYASDEMYAPPKDSTTSGRANPQGIPYLYLSKDYETTVYEARATFLDNISIGKFQLKDGKELTLVDFTSKQSPFDHDIDIVSFTKARLTRDIISQDLSEPLRRYDSELEYIPTQFICEYIRFFTKADGIQFNSSLEKGGVNIVLFDQSNIECVDVEVHQITEVKIKSSRVL